MTAGAPAEKVEEIERLHADAVSRLLLAGAGARRRGDHREAATAGHSRRAALPRVIGLWPISARSVHR